MATILTRPRQTDKTGLRRGPAPRDRGGHGMKILILGGYGTFGSRLVRLLADTPDLTLLIAGRDGARAQALAAQMAAKATLLPLTLNRRDIADALALYHPDLVIDASGPFQDYGPDPYLVARAAIVAGAPYLDLADGADFVGGIGVLDDAAKRAGVFVLSGVSSFPVLTHAVLAHMAQDMRLGDVTIGIAPSPRAGVGTNVLRAVLGYAGADVVLRRNGISTTGIGLVDSRRATIAVPGHVPLHPLRFSLVDVPDLHLLPRALPGIDSLWVGAAMQPAILHRGLGHLALMRRWLHLPPLTALAPLAHWLLNHLAWGEHRGGLFVRAEGSRDGRPVTLSWHLLAEGDDGPFIPAMAAALVAGKMQAGQAPAAGARAGIGALTLADFAPLFAERAIFTGWRHEGAAALYPRILGPVFDTLPEMLKALHRPGPRALWSGRASITRGRGPVAGLVARLFRFPDAAADQPVTVTFTTDTEGRETWVRRFGTHAMTSTQEAGRGRQAHLIVERFGPVAVALALEWTEQRLRLIPRRWTILGLPLPRALLPRGDTYEAEIDARFHFHVDITLPLIGPVVCYQGWLQQAT